MADLGIKAMAHQMAAHAAARQTHIARNVANADTPGYRATDLPDFGQALDPAMRMRTTRPLHIGVGASDAGVPAIERLGEASPNGNTVSLETEMMHAAEAKQAHDMALSIYASARDILTTALGRGR